MVCSSTVVAPPHLTHNNSIGCECQVDPNCGPQPVAVGPYLTQVCCNGQWRVMRARGALPPCVSLTRVRVTVFAFKNVYLCVTRPGLRLDYDVTIYDNATCQWIDDYEQGASAMCRSVRANTHTSFRFGRDTRARPDWHIAVSETRCASGVASSARAGQLHRR